MIMSLDTVTHHHVRNLGVLHNLSSFDPSRCLDIQLVEKVEQAQLEDQLPCVAGEDDKVILVVSKHGIKVVDEKENIVLQRHPLHTIIQLVNYSDGLGRYNIIVKTGQYGKTVFHCNIFQCLTQEDAKLLVSDVKLILEAVSRR